jgi:hypothetical protein
MRPLRLFAFLLVPCVAVACTSLLGDFNVGGDAGDDGGNDVGTSDASDANPSLDAGDASDAQTLLALACAVTNGSTVQITQNFSLHAEQVRVVQLPDDSIRIIVVDYPQPDGGGPTPPVVHAFIGQAHDLNQGFQDSPLTATGGYQIYDVVRYGGVAPGWAVIYIGNNGASDALFAARFPDNGTTWTTPVTLMTNLTNNNNGGQDATLVVLDAPNEKYYVAFTQTVGNTQTIFGGNATGNTTTSLPSIQTYATPTANRAVYSLVKPGVLVGGTQGFVMISPAGDNGPPPQGTPAFILAPPNNPIQLKPPNTLNYLPVGMASAVNPQTANVAVLTADLTNLVGNYNVGQTPVSGLASLDVQSLPASVPTTGDAAFTLEDLFVSANQQHWEVAGGSEQLLVVSTTNDPLNNDTPGGINFGWWDAPTGILRAYQGGPTNLFRTQAPFVIASDVTFETLVGSIAQLWVVYTNAAALPTQSNPPPASDLWIGAVGCQKQ